MNYLSTAFFAGQLRRESRQGREKVIKVKAAVEVDSFLRRPRPTTKEDQRVNPVHPQTGFFPFGKNRRLSARWVNDRSEDSARVARRSVKKVAQKAAQFNFLSNRKRNFFC
jgi:hypothetical protein